MKIEIGESLMLSWLKHIKSCQIVQLNWKPSTSTWELYNEFELESIMAFTNEYFKSKYNLDIFKQNRSSLQLLQQGEIDALGINLKSQKMEDIYAIDIAFHEGGLNYGDKEETIARVIKKMIRMAMTIKGYFDMSYGNIIFACPKINNSITVFLEECIKDLNTFMRLQGYNYNFILYVNENFKEKVFEPVLSIAPSVADTSELFMRSIQMNNLFTTDIKTRGEKQGKASAPKNETVEVKVPDLKGLKEVKIGALVRNTMRRLISENKLNIEIINRLTTYEFSKITFNINYPLLVKIDKTKSLLEQRQVNGRPRYWSEVVAINGEEYLTCQEWYEHNRSYFLSWVSKVEGV